MEPDDLTYPTDSALTRRMRSALDRRPADPDPEAATQRACALLHDVLGAMAETVVFASGYVPLSGEHTDYFDGLALLLRLPGGVSVAAARTPGAGRLAVQLGDSHPVEHALDVRGEGGHAPLIRLVGLLHQTLSVAHAEADVVVAVYSALPMDCPEALLGATAFAVGRALGGVLGWEGSDADVERIGAEAVSDVLARPFGPALLVAAQRRAPLVLVDTATHEAETLALPDALGWGLVDTGRARQPAANFYRHRLDVLAAAVAQLRSTGLEEIRSLRDLHHRDLSCALDELGGEAQRIVRHLATEDRRVQRLLVALRKVDGQIVGAHLLMSQASLRDDWQASTTAAEFIAREVEEAEGVYGGRLVGGGFGGCMLVVGRPFLVPPFLDMLAERFEEQFGTRPATAML